MRSTLLVLMAVVLLAGCSVSEISPLKFTPEKDAPWLAARMEKAGVTGDFATDIVKCLEDAAGNWPQVAAAIQTAKDHEVLDVCELIVWLPAISLLQTTPEVMLEHVREAQAARKASKWEIEQADYEDFVLNANIMYEQFCSWRKKLRADFSLMLKDDPLQTAAAINEWVVKNLRELKGDEESQFGWFKSPLEVLSSKNGSDGEIMTFCIAVMRSLAIPARFHQGGWVEFKHNGEWLPFYPFKPADLGKKNVSEDTARVYATPGKVLLTFTEKGAPAAEFKDFCIMSVHDAGALVRANPAVPAGKDGKTEIKLPPGAYRLVVGIRTRSGNIFMHHKPFELESGKNLEFNINLDIPRESWTKDDWLVRDEPQLKNVAVKLLNVPGKQEINLAEFVKADCAVLYLFRFDNESSTRILPGLKAFAFGPRARCKNAMMVHIGEKTAEVDKFIAENPNIPVAVIDEKAARETFKLPYSKESGRFTELPSVMLYKNGKLMLWADGFQEDLEKLLDAARDRE